ncbi:MAG: hypothetical protein QXP56_06540 [Archaeoglobaceae archaeon]
MVTITVSLREELYDKLREYCHKHKVRTSTVIAKLIEIALPILEGGVENGQGVQNR